MLNARIELRGEELFCADTGEGGLSTVRRLTPEALARLRGWAERYDTAVQSRALPLLVEIGRDIAAFLDEGDRWLDQVLGGTGEIALDIAVPGRPEERERILLDVPWELLAPNGGFPRRDNERLFRVTRRLGGSGTPAAPAYRDLSIAVHGGRGRGPGHPKLRAGGGRDPAGDKGLASQLSVEESGAIEFLGQRIAQDGPFEALHLSCHGDIVKGEPVLALEKPEGGLDLAGIAALSEALGEEERSRVWFFCRPAAPASTAPPAAFVQSLVRSGVSNAIGWDGSVNDADAIVFAETFYKELAREARSPMPRHAAGGHCCVPISPIQTAGGIGIWRGPMPARGRRRALRVGEPAASSAESAATRNFSTSSNRVPVATAAEFVGRRRQAQRILRAFRDREGAGVLIHGIGSQGKSSLAARIANRMPGHETVVIFERYDALAVFEALRNALPPRLQRDFDQTWREQVTNDASNLHNALLDMLEGPFRTTDPATRAKPVLLIIDDLELILETPKPGEAKTPVKTAVQCRARLDHRRVPRRRDRVASASDQPLHLRIDRRARRRPRGSAGCCPAAADGRDPARQANARRGSPRPEPTTRRCRRSEPGRSGSQDQGGCERQSRPSGDPLPADAERRHRSDNRAVAAVESYLESGEVPEDSHAAAEFFTHVSLTAFKDMLTPQETSSSGRRHCSPSRSRGRSLRPPEKRLPSKNRFARSSGYRASA